MQRKFASILVRYGVAVGAVLLTLPIKLLLRHYLEIGEEREAPFMLSLASVMVAGWYGGLGPGLFATALCVAIGDYFFMQPIHEFGLVTTAQKVRAATFI